MGVGGNRVYCVACIGPDGAPYHNSLLSLNLKSPAWYELGSLTRVTPVLGSFDVHPENIFVVYLRTPN